MSAPYSLQSPETLAKEYGGDKQKLAKAAQQGLVDPTAAVMAGMFIDRMRTAQGAMQAMQPTVAQQVFSPKNPNSAGTQPQRVAPQSMAMGGLASLSYNSDYADGGIVGYAEGNYISPYRKPREERTFLDELFPIADLDEWIYKKLAKDNPEPLATQEAKDRINKEFDILNPYMVGADTVSTPLPIQKNEGDMSYDLTQSVAPSTKASTSASTRNDPHDPVKATTPTIASPTMEVIGTPEDTLAAYRDQFDLNMGEDTKAYQDYLRRDNKKELRQDMWSRLAEAGFNMAGDTTPGTGSIIGDLAGSAGRAGAKVMPGVQSDIKAYRAQEGESMKSLAGIEEGKRKELNDVIKSGLTLEAQKDVARLQKDSPELRFMEYASDNGKDPIEAYALMKDIDTKAALSRYGITAENKQNDIKLKILDQWDGLSITDPQWGAKKMEAAKEGPEAVKQVFNEFFNSRVNSVFGGVSNTTPIRVDASGNIL